MLAKKFRLQVQEWIKSDGIKIRRSDLFIIKSQKNNLLFNRFGVIVSAKVSKSAVKRNKIKRTILNFIRLNKINESTTGRDFLIIVSPSVIRLKNNKEIKENLKKLL